MGWIENNEGPKVTQVEVDTFNEAVRKINGGEVKIGSDG